MKIIQNAIFPKPGLYVSILIMLSLSTLVLSFAREQNPTTTAFQTTSIEKSARFHGLSTLRNDNEKLEGVANKQFSNIISAAIGAAKIIAITNGGNNDGRNVPGFTPFAQR